jgi:hypothetical protein
MRPLTRQRSLSTWVSRLSIIIKPISSCTWLCYLEHHLPELNVLCLNTGVWNGINKVSIFLTPQ